VNEKGFDGLPHGRAGPLGPLASTVLKIRLQIRTWCAATPFMLSGMLTGRLGLHWHLNSMTIITTILRLSLSTV